MEQALVERYRNQWVAVDDDGHVVAHATSFEQLDQALSTMPPVHVVIRGSLNLMNHCSQATGTPEAAHLGKPS